MHLPKEAEQRLRANIKLCFDTKFEVTKEDKDWFQENFEISDPNSAFISFYTIVAFPPAGNGAELLPLELIIENAVRDTEDLPKRVGKRFIRLTSFEGEGAYYFDVESDKVYDARWGEESDMVEGHLKAFAASFFSFLQSYYK